MAYQSTQKTKEEEKSKEKRFVQSFSEFLSHLINIFVCILCIFRKNNLFEIVLVRLDESLLRFGIFAVVRAAGSDVALHLTRV